MGGASQGLTAFFSGRKREPKKSPGFQAGGDGIVGDGADQLGGDHGEGASGGPVDRAREVVGGLVIVVFPEIHLERGEVLLGVEAVLTGFQEEGGDAGADEGILVAANEDDLFGRGVGAGVKLFFAATAAREAPSEVCSAAMPAMPRTGARITGMSRLRLAA